MESVAASEGACHANLVQYTGVADGVADAPPASLQIQHIHRSIRRLPRIVVLGVLAVVWSVDALKLRVSIQVSPTEETFRSKAGCQFRSKNFLVQKSFFHKMYHKQKLSRMMIRKVRTSS